MFSLNLQGIWWTNGSSKHISPLKRSISWTNDYFSTNLMSRLMFRRTTQTGNLLYGKNFSGQQCFKLSSNQLMSYSLGPLLMLCDCDIDRLSKFFNFSQLSLPINLRSPKSPSFSIDLGSMLSNRIK